MMSTLGWSNEYVVFQSSILLVFIGVFSISTGALFMGTHISNRLQPRFTFLIALLMATSVYIFTYPWQHVGRFPLQLYNRETFPHNPSIPIASETLEAGCKPEEYSWCYSATATHPWLLMPAIVLVMGIATTMGDISIDTIYSKLLGHLDQVGFIMYYIR